MPADCLPEFKTPLPAAGKTTMDPLTPIPQADPQEKPSVASVTNPATNRILYIGAGFAALVVIASVVMGIGETAEVKSSMFKWAVCAGAITLAAALSGAGFAVGKFLEGVIPLVGGGIGPVKPTLLTAATAELKTFKGLTREDVREEVRAALAEPAIKVAPVGLVGDNVRGPNNPVDQRLAEDPSGFAPRLPGSTLPVFALLCLPLIALLSGGCAGTSVQFQKGVKAGVDNVVLDMRDYTAAADWDRNHNGAIDPDEAQAKEAESAKTEALAAAVADDSKITTTGLKTAWEPVKPVWVNYVNSDPVLDTPQDKKYRLDTGTQIDSLIKLETERQKSFLDSLNPFGPK